MSEGYEITVPPKEILTCIQSVDFDQAIKCVDKDQGNAYGILILWHLKAMFHLQTNLKWPDAVLKWWTNIEDLFRTLVVWKLKDVKFFTYTFSLSILETV